MPAAMTYNSLTTDVISYLERNTDADTIAQIPRFIMLGEQRIASEFKGLGFQTVVTGAFTPGADSMAKPTWWRSPISFNYKVDGERKPIILRTYEFCRTFWPIVSAVAAPRYYADYNYDNLLLAPTPDIDYQFELVYYARLTPLDATHQTNWLTQYAPQLLFYAAMLEAQLYLKNWDRKAVWQTDFDRAMAALNGEDQGRKVDREVTTNGKP